MDHHDCVFPGERHRITGAQVFIELCTPDKEPRGNEAPHHAIVLDVMVSRGRGPLGVLFAPRFTAHDALLSAADGDVGQHLLAAAWGCLPTSLA
jgi:hypothetical protein